MGSPVRRSRTTDRLAVVERRPHEPSNPHPSNRRTPEPNPSNLSNQHPSNLSNPPNPPNLFGYSLKSV
jgi:hypothetical protein